MVLYAVNAGSSLAEFIASDGVKYERDRYYSLGSAGSTTDAIANTADDVLYQSERWGTFSYNFPVAEGTYDVTLHMVEAYYGANGVSGSRVFNVEVEGNALVRDFNPLVAAGGHDTAHQIELKGIEVTDGLLSLDFSATSGEANVAAIVVRGLEGNAVELPEEPVTNPGTPGPAVPMGCTGNSTVTADDMILFDGGPQPLTTGLPLAMNQNWLLDEAWGDYKLSLVSISGGTGIRYGGTPQYHGFKFTPPLRRPFQIKGADIYVQLDRPNPNNPLPTFGLRVIKPGEFEGDGGASTTTWMNGSNGSRFVTINTECTLISLTMPQSWNANTNVADRFIWEMQSNWNTSDNLVVRRVVLKGFKYAP